MGGGGGLRAEGWEEEVVLIQVWISSAPLEAACGPLDRRLILLSSSDDVFLSQRQLYFIYFMLITLFYLLYFIYFILFTSFYLLYFISSPRIKVNKLSKLLLHE